ncbi:MAG: hypothetical protein SPL14_03565 [Candidatus Onthomorpha sp.]|nr:hypothetical protein [Bacteroidales bacterium]MDD7485374.1 hypothetical protein [Bacteroidales bacterium]MDY5698492.1 hypothetical protein [Candidatus Onthomorpha sp.]
MQTSVKLPQWLDDLIFKECGAKYKRSNSTMVVIDWDKTNINNYLGTYFPRSYTESYCIFSEYFSKYKAEWINRDCITVFDFGCGTGGEIIGMLMAIKNQLPMTEVVKVDAFDGNFHALRLLERIAERTEQQISLKVDINPIPYKVEDFYDLSSMIETICKDRKYDIFMTFKAVCEFVTKERFEQSNAYTHIIQSFLPNVKSDGIMLLDDVTSYNDVSQEWLPKMMDEGIKASGRTITISNSGYNQVFKVSHSRFDNDVSKVAWRII